ncbi:FAD:protein FMN transferase [Minwuia sp.]|uniref:FAD:protein FMN transferase n=1 Tax=Minwuia sp. TaxID=2493630 RepID=UPI003A905F29
MTVTRRRFIAISAAAMVAPLGGIAASAATETVTWRGIALGAQASITLKGSHLAKLDHVVKSVESEISRLEDIFSLYRSNSVISRLNREGQIATPPPELLQVISLVSSVHRQSSGAFDPTVQRLWRLHARAGQEGRQPDTGELDQVRQLTGWQHVRYSTTSVRFRRPGMEMTLNGIAQGFVADRVADLLRREGFADVLIDMGEISAQGQRPSGGPWRVGVADPAGRVVTDIDLSNRALATSSPGGGLPEDKLHSRHMIDPRTGAPGGEWNLVSVSDAQAAVADALSTAISLLDRRAAEALMHGFPGARLELLS